jgi:hypothetical protein
MLVPCGTPGSRYFIGVPRDAEAIQLAEQKARKRGSRWSIRGAGHTRSDGRNEHNQFLYEGSDAMKKLSVPSSPRLERRIIRLAREADAIEVEVFEFNENQARKDAWRKAKRDRSCAAKSRGK